MITNLILCGIFILLVLDTYYFIADQFKKIKMEKTRDLGVRSFIKELKNLGYPKK